MKVKLIEEKEDKAIFKTSLGDFKRKSGQTVVCKEFREEDNRIEVEFEDGSRTWAYPSELTFLDETGKPLKKEESLAAPLPEDRQDIEKLRVKVAKDARVPSNSVVVTGNGTFHLYNLDEDTCRRIENNLRAIPGYKNVASIATKYDFNKFYGVGLPKRLYDLSGLFDFQNFDIDEKLDENIFDKIKERKAAAQAEYEAELEYERQRKIDKEEDRKKSKAFDALPFDKQCALIRDEAKAVRKDEEPFNHMFWFSLGVEFGTQSFAKVCAQGLIMVGDLYISPDMCDKDDHPGWNSENWNRKQDKSVFGWLYNDSEN